jgi:hypothetical protein
MRPPMLAGPMERNRKFVSSGLDDRLIIAVSRRTMPLWADAGWAATIARPATTRDQRKNLNTGTHSGAEGPRMWFSYPGTASRQVNDATLTTSNEGLTGA